jgi:hypothetical protein
MGAGQNIGRLNDKPLERGLPDHAVVRDLGIRDLGIEAWLDAQRSLQDRALICRLRSYNAANNHNSGRGTFRAQVLIVPQ